MKIVLMIIIGIIRNNATAQHMFVTILQFDFMIFTLAFCFSDLFDKSCVERMIRCTRYYICLLYHTFYVFARKNILFFYIFLQFHQFLHFVFEGTKTGGLSAEYVCYGLFFVCLIKSVMNTRTGANGLTCLLTITYPAIILRLLSYSIIQR